MIKLKDGFKGEAAVVLPKMIADILESDSYTRHLYVTDMGFYPRAANHYRERLEPLGQNILIVCVDGKGWVKVGDRTFSVGTDQCFVVPAGEVHSYGADSDDPWTIYWIHFSGDMAGAIADALGGIVRSLPRREDSGRELFDCMLDLLSTGMSIENLRYAMALFHHYIGRLRYLVSGNRSGCGDADGESDTIDRVISYIDTNVSRHLTLADLAAFSGYSASHLSALFTARTGLSPINYCNIAKVRHACHLLDTTSLRLNQICFRVGIDDPYYFSRFFTKMMGMSPRDYRRRPRP
ncbi:MAG: AraC family transcriptional regulator [Muribaculum sp.]|nr:AraC family transcriptional regulator [Muribaculum sp.]